ncbi:hypothetical protein JXO52_08150 [bacterium]|nr:hypothetical protein [bacterium]
MRIVITIFVCLVPGWAGYAQQPLFGDRVDRGVIDTSLLPEVSGAACSTLNADILWVHNDSGGENLLYALDARTAAVVAVYRVAGVPNHDWEDIAAGPGPEPGVSFLYIADIGDNEGERPVKQIIRIREPVVPAGSARGVRTLTGAEICSFRYPDGVHNAETLLLDPLSRDMYIVTKSRRTAAVYRLVFPRPVDRIVTAERCGTIDMPQATAGSVTVDGTGIIIKNYFSMFYWRRDPAASLFQALSSAPAILPYIPEPQGEAVCWKREGNRDGFFTLSEQKANMPVHLFYYPPQGRE